MIKKILLRINFPNRNKRHKKIKQQITSSKNETKLRWDQQARQNQDKSRNKKTKDNIKLIKK